MNSDDANPAVWAQRYEGLRQHALNADALAGARPLGLILLIRDGLAGWMRGWRESLDPGPEISPLGMVRRAWLPASDWQSQLTMVLAQMAVPHLQSCSCL